MGNGDDILAPKDPWVPFVSSFKPTLRPDAVVDPAQLLVIDLICRDRNCWDVGTIRRLFSKESTEAILHIRLPHEAL